MKSNRVTKNTQQTKLDKYTLPKEIIEKVANQKNDGEGTSESGELTLHDIMVAIKDVKGVLETKIDTTAIEVNLIRADLKKLNTRLHTAEETIQALTSQNKELAQQVKFLQTSSETMAARIEDQEGRSRRNNIRITGVPEKNGGALSGTVCGKTYNRRAPTQGSLQNVYGGTCTQSTRKATYSRSPPQNHNSPHIQLPRHNPTIGKSGTSSEM